MQCLPDSTKCIQACTHQDLVPRFYSIGPPHEIMVVWHIAKVNPWEALLTFMHRPALVAHLDLHFEVQSESPDVIARMTQSMCDVSCAMHCNLEI